ncbi:MAG: hypothetical protein HQ556_00605 [Candidatus Marinimicrobia bacterium]|nr:hypothetical protein [Candidatus Neomarinimicrobiota bacterium]
MNRNWNIAVVTTMVLILNACSSTTYISQTATEEFRTDGQRSEWTGRFQIPDGEKFALGLSHTRNYLYVAISSIDRDFKRQLAVGGLTLWLDVKGGKRQDLGIKFEGLMPQEKRSGSSRGRQQDNKQDRERRFELPGIFDGDLTLIVTDTKAGKSLGPADLLASANSIDETLFIEYQIPLAMLGEEFDMEKLGLGLESTIERPAMAGGHSGGMSGGQRGGRSGGMGGGKSGGGQRGGARPGGSPGSGIDENNIEVWTKVKFPQ